MYLKYVYVNPHMKLELRSKVMAGQTFEGSG